jgi:hypothetical protein
MDEPGIIDRVRREAPRVLAATGLRDKIASPWPVT